jgi:hypothetical protein
MTLRWARSRRPRRGCDLHSATAALLGVVGMELLIFGGFGTVVVGREYLPERRHIDAAEAAIAHMRAEPALPPPTLQAHEAEIDRWHRSSIRTAMPVVLAVLAVGVIFLALALAIALAAGWNDSGRTDDRGIELQRVTDAP